MTKQLLPICALFLMYLCASSQTKNNQETHTYQINKTSETITVDGELGEEVWAGIEPFDQFWYSFPVDDRAVEPEYQTEVRMTYDDRFIYVAAICYGDGPFIIPSLKRDNNQFWSGDVFSIAIDAVNERTNGYGFATNPAGVQHDTQFGANTGTRGGGGGSGFNTAWDNKWIANSKQYPDKWTTEMAIPFKSLKYGEKTTWGLNFVRGVSATNSWHTWAPVPVQFTGVDLGYTGALIWDETPPKAKSNVSVIPYVLGSGFKDYEENEDLDLSPEIGVDAKVAITSNLTLDLTVNPDFSQVDVDEQVTNLTTVNIRFPERRLFFLENTDIFSEFGIPPMRPFFSRKIGLDDDGNTIPIQFGGRLSGNINKDLRIGLMNLQTGSTNEFLAQNYGSFAFNQRIIGRTVLKGYFHNRQAYEESEFSTSNYNRVLGGEVDYRSQSGAFRANAGYGQSFVNGLDGDNETYHAILSYNSRNISFYTNIMTIEDNYVSDVGFITLQFQYDAINDQENRIGYNHNFTRFAYIIYPENPRINNHRIGFRSVWDWRTLDNDLFIGRFSGTYNLNFANTASIEVEASREYGELLFPFDFTDSEPLPTGEYNWSWIGAAFASDRRNEFFYTIGFQAGGFYNGERRQFLVDLNYRVQPWGNFALRFVQNDLDFPKPYGSESLTLIGPKIEINMSRNLFWTTFLQYNTQRDNLNINSRFQWQFKPLSNLFIVYTDNYAIEEWGPKNRGLVVKLNYWLNL